MVDDQWSERWQAYKYVVREQVVQAFRDVCDLIRQIVIPANAGIQRGAGVDGVAFYAPVAKVRTVFGRFFIFLLKNLARGHRWIR
ncbi:MAG: hypothetical protein GY866_33915 [Proteobacteria bacterium]|nr:hypothetical protein [Pseudomonadota bacterium]